MTASIFPSSSKHWFHAAKILPQKTDVPEGTVPSLQTMPEFLFFPLSLQEATIPILLVSLYKTECATYE